MKSAPLPAAQEGAAKQKGYVLVIAAACLWATSGVLTKQILVRYAPPPLTLAFWRDCLTFTMLVLALGLFRRNWLRLDRKALLPLLGLGIIGLGAFHVLWVYAVAWIGVAPATVFNYTAPAFVVLITWFLWREPISWRQVGAVLLTFAGCLLLVRLYDLSQLRLNWIGLLVGLGTGITWAMYAIFSKMALKYCNSWTLVTAAFGLSALTILLPQAGQTLSFPWTQPASIWLWLGLLALVPTVGGFCLYTWALNYLAASTAVITAMIEIIVATLLAFLIFGDTLQSIQILGGALIVAGIYLLARQESNGNIHS